MNKEDETKVNQLNNNIDKLSILITDEHRFDITIDRARWLYDGSGSIIIDSIQTVKFYIEQDNITYMTDDVKILNLFNLSDINTRLINIFMLKNNVDAIFNLYY